MKSISPLQWLASGFAGGLAVIVLMASASSSYLFSVEEALFILFGAAFGILTMFAIHQARRLQRLEEQLLSSNTDSATVKQTEKQSDRSTLDIPLKSSTQPEPANLQAPDSAVQAIQSTEPELPPISERAASEPRPSVLKSKVVSDWAERFGSINLPVKIGVLILFVGLVALLRHAADQGWLSMPIELRLAGIGLLGIVGLWVGWQQRIKQRVFGLSLQGGAIGVLVLTLFAGFRLYQLIPQAPALIISAVLIFGGGALAVIQRSKALALFSMLAGFAAPLLLANDQGGPLPLFIWYAILNLGVFFIALKQHWPLLTRIGFVSTFIIASGWSVLTWQPEHYLTAQLFLILFFVLYFLLPILQLRTGQEPSKLDVLLVFGLPLFAFPLQIALLGENRMGIAFSALLAAVLYLLAARFLIPRASAKMLTQAFAVLAVGLATMAIPFAFSGPTIVLVWALEGAALIWFGCISGRRLARIAGLILIGLAAAIWSVLLVFEYRPAELLLLNASGLGGLAIVLAAWLAAWRYQQAGANSLRYNALFSFGFVFWLVMGMKEIDRFFSHEVFPSSLLGFLALSALISGWVHWRRGWSNAGLASAAMLACVALTFIAQSSPFNPLLNWAWVTGLILIAGLLLLDWLFANNKSTWRARISLFAHLAVAAWAGQLLWFLSVNAEWSAGWQWLFAGLPILGLNAWSLTARRPLLCLNPINDEQKAVLQKGLAAVLLLALLFSLQSTGNAAPLIWLPVFNPLELAQFIALGLIFIHARTLNHPHWQPAVLAFVVITFAALRSVHQLGDVAWNEIALFDSAQAQATITIVWTVTGVIGWVIGSRRAMSVVWRVGAILLSVVLIKLLLIDRQFLSNVAGIASFVAVGLLSILVGYLAPAPPASLPVAKRPSTSTDEP